MPSGGKRAGAGRKVGVSGTRAWFRALCERPTLKKKVEEIILAEVKKGDLTNFWKAIEHGFGRPPQALDVKIGGDQEAPLVFDIRLADGTPLPSAVAELPTSSSSEHGT